MGFQDHLNRPKLHKLARSSDRGADRDMNNPAPRKIPPALTKNAEVKSYFEKQRETIRLLVEGAENDKELLKRYALLVA